MRLPHCTRRRFLAAAGCVMASSSVAAQSPSLAHISVAELERGRVLAEAKEALTAPVAAVLAVPAPQPVANSFFSEAEPDIRTAGAAGAPAMFRAHAKALRDMSATVACLCAASLLTNDPRYAARASEHLRVALLSTANRINPQFDLAGCAPGTMTGAPVGIVDLVPLAELARAVSFIYNDASMTAEEWEAVTAWFRSAQSWLNSNRAALIARDTKDHRASAWLLIASAFARLLRDENGVEDCRKLFRKPTLRNQVRADGVFPQEVATPNPYRNTLMNFDLLAGACQLLHSPFDPLWPFELIDGVGMWIVSAYLYPLIAHPERWPFTADAAGFRNLPGGRPGLLFAGRVYDRPEYVATWHDAAGEAVPEIVAASFPIHQPLLWTARAPHGF